jgi:Lon protease-like protein
MSDAQAPPAFEIALFPLGTVLFPGGRLELRIFEPRYLDMVARCLRGSNRFGVVAIRRGSVVGAAATYAVGTLAAIVDWGNGRDGVLVIVARGTEVFRCERSTRAADGLYVGQARTLPRGGAAGVPAAYAGLVALARNLPTTGGGVPDVDDPDALAYRLAEALPLSLSVKQSLLEIDDAVVRLERLQAALRAASLLA